MSPNPNRRLCLQQLGAWLAAAGAAGPALASAQGGATRGDGDAPPAQVLAMAWRPGAAAADDADPQAHRIGLLQLDWAGRQARWAGVHAVPSRPHGLLADGRGGYVAVAARAGDWLVHVPADPAEPPRWCRPGQDEGSPRSLNGHLLFSADGRWLFGTETDRRDGSAWLVRRDAHSLRTDSAWPLPGLDAHQLLPDAQDGSLLVAMGGIARDARGRKRALQDMAPALLRVDARDGRVSGRWTLPDARLSLRHMAWSVDGERRLLGIALQAEHDEPDRRRQAPLLALWDGQALTLPLPHGGEGAGYAGDICAGPGGSFLLSAQRSGRALLWHPDAPDALIGLAELKEVCALGHWRDAGGLGLLMSAARGVARWQAGRAHMLPWPEVLAADNHLALPL